MAVYSTYIRLLVVIVMLVVSSVHSYHTGAGNDSCTNLTPGHEGTTAKTTASPYSVTVSTDKYQPNGTVTVTLSGTQSFKGFLVVARPEDDAEGTTVGTFSVTKDGGKSLSQAKCDGGSTHTADFSVPGKDSIELIWKAPGTNEGNLTFYATFVQVKADYWVKVPSATITNTTVASTTTTTTVKPPTTTPSGGDSNQCNMVLTAIAVIILVMKV